jgi:SAM-dependent methyltransferase
MNQKIRDEWNQNSDEWYRIYMSERELDIIENNPERAFPREIYALIKNNFPNLKGKRVCVPSSGDNTAVFGFHLLGAKVTSLDISERQLYNAKKIADKKGWDIEYICEDSMNFSKVKSDEFDLVYTSNGVHVWISDLVQMYRNFYRVLHTKGKYIMFELHPINRPLDDSDWQIKAVKPYEEVGPFREATNYHWRTQDIVNNIINAGFNLTNMEEFHSRIGDLDACWYRNLNEAEADNNIKFDWKQNPFAVLPQWLGLCGEKY